MCFAPDALALSKCVLNNTNPIFFPVKEEKEEGEAQMFDTQFATFVIYATISVTFLSLTNSIINNKVEKVGEVFFSFQPILKL